MSRLTFRSARLATTAAAAAAALLIAGTGTPATGSAFQAGDTFFDLSAVAEPTMTGAEMTDALATFASEFTLRVTGTPTELLAAQFIMDELKSYGYDVSMESYARNGQSAPTATINGIPSPNVRSLIGKKAGNGTRQDQIMFVGHYDSLPQSGDAAYDNGTGTILQLFMAKQFAELETNRPITVVFYNGEEEGALASGSHAPAMKARGEQVAVAMGFDMVGIGYPVANPVGNVNCMCIYHGPGMEGFNPILSHANFDFLGFPQGTDTVRLAGTNTRNSDERNFANQGYPTLRWTGLRTASNYSQYHMPNDNMETIYAESGGREFFEQAYLNTLKSAYYTAMTIDNAMPNAAFTYSVDGNSVTLDGSSSSDKDGAISSYTWTVDGQTYTGSTATIDLPAGTHSVSLTVSDNIWSAATTTATTTITVG